MVSATPATVLARGEAIHVDDVSVEYVTKKSGTVRALDHVSIAVERGEFVALVGPSGCGKSTLLRLVAALEEPTSGSIAVGGEKPGRIVAQHRLGVGFQDSALLPWLTVTKNLELPFRLAKRPVDRARISEFIDLVGLTGFEQAKPRQLSGGMKQRVSLARALIMEPSVLLLDEPFGALDAVTRRRMNDELQRIWTERSVTTLLVTHDVDEAVYLADRVIALTGRPGHVDSVHNVPFERPHTVDLRREPAFHELVDTITATLNQPAVAAGKTTR